MDIANKWLANENTIGTPKVSIPIVTYGHLILKNKTYGLKF